MVSYPLCQTTLLNDCDHDFVGEGGQCYHGIHPMDWAAGGFRGGGIRDILSPSVC